MLAREYFIEFGGRESFKWGINKVGIIAFRSIYFWM